MQDKSKAKKALSFVPSTDFIPSMEERRGDFHGVQITGIAKMRISNIDFSEIEHDDGDSIYYDVTNLTDDLKVLYGIEPLVFKLLGNKHNYTSKILSRKDNKLGLPKFLSNGSTVIGQGMFKDLKEGFVEMITSQILMFPELTEIGYLLPPIDSAYDALIVANIDTSTTLVDWGSYFAPFSTEMWMAIIVKCFTFSIFVYIIEWSHNYTLVINDNYNMHKKKQLFKFSSK